MNLFDDLINKGKIFSKLDELGCISKGFNKRVIEELREFDWFENIFVEAYPNDPNYIELEKLPIFIVYLEESEQNTIEGLVDIYNQPNIAQGHFYDFLIINADQKLIAGLGLGRKNQFFCHFRENYSEFIPANQPGAVEIETKLISNMPWDILSKFKEQHAELGNLFDMQDDIPLTPDQLEQILEDGPNDEGVYFIEEDDEEYSKEDLEQFINDFWSYEQEINTVKHIYQAFFPNLHIGSLNTSDY